MKEAIKEARSALEQDEVPIGAVVVSNDRIIARGYNQTEKLRDATAHAEMIAITGASNHIGSKYLNNCTLYVTIEPCLMCAAAIKWSRISKLVYGADEPKFGFTNYQVEPLSSGLEIVKGVSSEECAELMKRFFKAKRNQ